MLKSLKKIFEKSQNTTETDNIDELTILCGLMMEAANTDGNVSQDEINNAKLHGNNGWKNNTDTSKSSPNQDS